MKIRQVLVATAVIALLCSGCTLDVESYLQPPKAQGEQQVIQAALETYIRDSGMTNMRYTLKYPAEGSYTSAFVLGNASGGLDADSAGEATLAVAFYSVSAGSETHVNLLHRDDTGWTSVGDFTGPGMDILQVEFGDLDRDGTVELLTGWSTYNSKERRLYVFSLNNGLSLLSSELLYTQLFVGDITASGCDSLLLLHIGGGNEVTATLEELRDGHFISSATVPLDGYIQQFSGMSLCRLAEGVHGLYVDAVKDAGTSITELIYYDGSGLRAPFYDPSANVTTVTGRASGLPSADVDGDGQVEIPQCTLLPQYAENEKTESYAWLTEWRSWSYQTDTWSVRSCGVVNQPDGYIVTLNEERIQLVTTQYDSTSRTLSFLNAESGKVWMKVRVTGAAAAEDTEVFENLYPATDSGNGYEVWYDPETLNPDKVRYMVSRLEG